MEAKRIFVVEDESIVSLEIQSRLKSLGYLVAGTASSGDEAIRKVLELKPDLILMDIRIKGNIDGIDTAAEIHKHLEIPVIFLTAYADEATLQRAKVTDPFGYIIKPFEERELEISIEIALFKDHTQKILREKDKWFSSILKSVGDAVIATDKTGKIRYINNVAESLTEFSSKDAIGTDINNVFKVRSELTKQPVKNAFQKIMEKGEAVGLANHTELISKSGKIYPIADAGTPIKDDYNNIIGIVVVFKDMSYYKKTEEQIKLQTFALNSAYNGVVITDETGKILWCNNALKRLTGYLPVELVNQNTKIFKSGSQDSQLYKDMWQVIKAGKVWKGEIINLKKNGEKYYEEMTITPLKNDSDEIVNYIAIKDDITERIHKEKELKKAKADAERSDRLKSEFLAQMSHEIRTPIHIISSFMQLYEDDLDEKLSPELKNSILDVRSASQRIISTIESILNMAQLKSGTFIGKPKKLNLFEDIITPLIGKWKHDAKEKHIELIISGDYYGIQVKADLHSFSQAINHVVDNAIKYTDKGTIKINFKNDNEYVSICINDTGNGISEDYLPYIFEPFSQEQQGYNRKYEGNGLGMALVKQYCALNNSSITIESKKWVGTTVKITIPKL